MTMVGQIGPRGLPKPGSKSVSEALNLLSVMGADNKAGLKLLKEMKEVQGHNEKVLDEAKAAIAEATKLQKAVLAAQEKLTRDTDREQSRLDDKARSLSMAEKALQAKERKLAVETASEYESLEKLKSIQQQTDLSLKVRENEVSEKEKGLADDRADLEKQKAAVESERKSLAAKVKKLKDAMR